MGGNTSHFDSDRRGSSLRTEEQQRHTGKCQNFLDVVNKCDFFSISRHLHPWFRRDSRYSPRRVPQEEHCGSGQELSTSTLSLPYLPLTIVPLYASLYVWATPSLLCSPSSPKQICNMALLAHQCLGPFIYEPPRRCCHWCSQRCSSVPPQQPHHAPKEVSQAQVQSNDERRANLRKMVKVDEQKALEMLANLFNWLGSLANTAREGGQGLCHKFGTLFVHRARTVSSLETGYGPGANVGPQSGAGPPGHGGGKGGVRSHWECSIALLWASYGFIIFISINCSCNSGVHLRCLGPVWFTILNLSTAHPSLHRSLVIRRPK